MEEAKQLLSKKYPYEIPYSVNRWMYDEAGKYIKSLATFHCEHSGNVCLPHERAKYFINKIELGLPDGRVTFDGSLCTEQLDSIFEILVDNQNALAVIKYRTRYVRKEPYFSEFYKRGEKNILESITGEYQTYEVECKKYDKGWRILEEE